MFGLRNKKIIFLLRTLNSSPGMHILSVLLEPSTLTPTQSKGIGESLIGNMGGGGGGGGGYKATKF